LDRAASVLSEDHKSGPKATSGKRQKRGSRKRRSPTAAAVAESRRQAMHRFLVEQGRPTAFSEIHRSLRLSEFSARSALKRLIAEGAVARVGTGSATRYQARSESLADSAPSAGARPLAQAQGTMQGRLLATLEDRGSASLEELAQAVRASREVIEKECGVLIREEEIRMARRDGRAVYVSQGAA
jgi:predicted ArsR family transcriptional regulator